MAGTQLYNSQHNKIYPITEATAVNITSSNISKQNAEECIIDLYTKLGNITKDDETVTNIKIEIRYLNSNISSEQEIRSVDANKWGTSFTIPDSEKNFAWKHTKIYVEGTNSETNTYEIVAVASQDKSQTIYASFSGAEVPELKFIPLKVNGEEQKNQDGTPIWDVDAMNSDDYLPGPTVNGVSKWTRSPQSISAENPKLYMAIRYRNENGKWDLFQGPYLYANWAYDSVIKFKYILMQDDMVPPYNANNEDPNLGITLIGNRWEDNIQSIPDSFVGRIWMISATYSGGRLISSENNTIWSNPTILSIIK